MTSEAAGPGEPRDRIGLVGRLRDLDPLGRVDPVGLAPALSRTGLALLRRPDRLATVALSSTGTMTQVTWTAAKRSVGVIGDEPGVAADRRFADRTWDDNAFYWWLRRWYAECERVVRELAAGADVDEETRQKSSFALNLILDGLAPTNFGLLNPMVRKRAFETGGLSLARGARLAVQDMVRNGGRPRQMSAGDHEVGRTLAATPGQVVFRNELMELIQYSPTTETVHEVPMLCSPPWINKYYIMDLAPGRSLVEWAVDHGHTVFMISYRNPDESMRDVSLDDYLVSGPVAALEAIASITGCDEVNLVSLCLGGTLGMATLCYLDATRDEHPERPRVRSATFLNTLVDFSEPGLLGTFTDRRTVDRLERRMSRSGFMTSTTMQDTFNLLRGNDLVWNYLVSNWLMGEEPPVFDLLSWNADGTRMPAAMHAFYLRSCYLDNELARGVMTLDGVRLDPAEVDQDVYVLAAEMDHIAPWTSSYRGARLPRGDVRFVLSNSGHIAGIVNPPNPKSKHWTLDQDPGERLPEDPNDWRAAATQHAGTWWEDWVRWISDRAGGQVPPPGLGGTTHEPLTPAPGTYVLEQ